MGIKTAIKTEGCLSKDGCKTLRCKWDCLVHWGSATRKEERGISPHSATDPCHAVAL